ncbi:mobilization protein [Streptomyces mashuensis]|uniref:Mobilization protein n=1 Tax=Streptomyces mashuensis TaxID=33904 RepID=A0A919ECS0_9ACTN|nr:mobilization protein [Streptomyces mashuensis]GHF41741.1 mobilization protein [Streptomyces mashuensis]
MIAKITSGKNTAKLIAYLYGPGKANEHTDPHLVASWDGFAPDPGRSPDPCHAKEQLVQALDLRVKQAGNRAPEQYVWHCSIRAAPEDHHLTDEDWADVARRVVAATGIAPDGDPDGCRWVAVRHADDHIHIAATKVRGDLRPARHWNDYLTADKELAAIEKEYGLRQVVRGDRTAAKGPTNAERRKAERLHRGRTPREELRETVRRAVAGADSETEFFIRLANAGLLIRQRIAPSGDLLGYTVALPSDRNKDGRPIFYSGSKLAPDLSLPRIRHRFTDSQRPAEPDTRTDRPRADSPAAARRAATQAAWEAVSVIEQGDDATAASEIAAGGEVLDALAKTSAAATRQELREAAVAFERASWSHIRAERLHDRALRKAARDLVYSGPVLGRGEDGAATAMVIDTLIFLAIAAANWHSKHQHAQQAAAARQAADHLRAAYRQAAAAPLTALRQQGQALPAHHHRRHAATVRAALPELAEKALAEPGWYGLAATLSEAERAGYETGALLAEIAEQRELDSAGSISDVLVWRIRRTAGLPAHTPSPQTKPMSMVSARPTRPSASTAGRRPTGPAGRPVR